MLDLIMDALRVRDPRLNELAAEVLVRSGARSAPRLSLAAADAKNEPDHRVRVRDVRARIGPPYGPELLDLALLLRACNKLVRAAAQRASCVEPSKPSRTRFGRFGRFPAQREPASQRCRVGCETLSPTRSVDFLSLCHAPGVPSSGWGKPSRALKEAMWLMILVFGASAARIAPPARGRSPSGAVRRRRAPSRPAAARRCRRRRTSSSSRRCRSVSPARTRTSPRPAAAPRPATRRRWSRTGTRSGRAPCWPAGPGRRPGGGRAGRPAAGRALRPRPPGIACTIRPGTHSSRPSG